MDADKTARAVLSALTPEVRDALKKICGSTASGSGEKGAIRIEEQDKSFAIHLPSIEAMKNAGMTFVMSGAGGLCVSKARNKRGDVVTTLQGLGFEVEGEKSTGAAKSSKTAAGVDSDDDAPPAVSKNAKPQSKFSRAPPAKPNAIVDSDDESDDAAPTTKTVAKAIGKVGGKTAPPASKGKAAAAKADSSDEETEDEVPKSKAAPKGKAAPKSVPDSSDDDTEEEAPPAKGKAAAPTKSTSKTATSNGLPAGAKVVTKSGRTIVTEGKVDVVVLKDSKKDAYKAIGILTGNKTRNFSTAEGNTFTKKGYAIPPANIDAESDSDESDDE